MTPIQLTDCTRRFKAPKDWDAEKHGECQTLEIHDRGGFMISAWMPSPDELKLLNDGKPVFLHIHGDIHPVVALSVA